MPPSCLEDCWKPIRPAIKQCAVFAVHLIAAMLLYEPGLGESLDVIVTLTDDGKAWNLTDLLGRSKACITETSDQQIMIHLDGHALEIMAGMRHGPFASLDAALAAIEKHTRGVCRLYPGEDQLWSLAGGIPPLLDV